jgi:hypothetical protein
MPTSPSCLRRGSGETANEVHPLRLELRECYYKTSVKVRDVTACSLLDRFGGTCFRRLQGQNNKPNVALAVAALAPASSADLCCHGIEPPLDSWPDSDEHLDTCVFSTWYLLLEKRGHTYKEVQNALLVEQRQKFFSRLDHRQLSLWW